jgi:hypothetical protein
MNSSYRRHAAVPAVAVLAVIGLVASARDAAAQSTTTTTYSGPLATMVPNVLVNTIHLAVGAPARVTGGAVSPPHDAHFNVLNDLSFTGPNAAATAAGVNRALASQFATFPLGSSSGGFTWNFDQSTGGYTRASQSYGPLFAERALTVGRNRFGLGFNYQHTTYKSFEGQSLEDGAIRFYLPHTDCCPAATAPNGLLSLAFEGDVLEASMDLQASTDTFTLFATYGVTDRLDVGVAIPVSRIDMDLTLNAEIMRFSTTANPALHVFPDGSSRASYPTTGSATGLGDVVVRTKYLVASGRSAQIAAALDLRLPTGDADNLLGTGTTQGKVYAILSTGGGAFAQHVNIGYTFSGGGSLDRYLPTGLPDGTRVGGVTIGGTAGTNGNSPSAQALSTAIFGDAPAISDEVNFAAGVEWAATGRLTIIGDVLGRSLRDAGRFDLATKTVTFNRCASSDDCVAAAPGGPFTATDYQGRELRELTPQTGNVNQFYGTAGFKLNPGGNFLVGASVLFPLTDHGLRSKYTTVVGVEYAF